MRAIVYHGKEDMRAESVPDPGLQSDTDVLLRVERTAICGSDLHLWHLDAPLGTNGFVVGHEFLGTVEDVGRGVATVKKGDRVLTQGGMFGTVVGVQKDRVMLKIADNVKVEYQKPAIVAVLDEKAAAGSKEDEIE